MKAETDLQIRIKPTLKTLEAEEGGILRDKGGSKVKDILFEWRGGER